jgi:hypothetical protein
VPNETTCDRSFISSTRDHLRVCAGKSVFALCWAELSQQCLLRRHPSSKGLVAFRKCSLELISIHFQLVKVSVLRQKQAFAACVKMTALSADSGFERMKLVLEIVHNCFRVSAVHCQGQQSSQPSSSWKTRYNIMVPALLKTDFSPQKRAAMNAALWFLSHETFYRFENWNY